MYAFTWCLIKAGWLRFLCSPLCFVISTYLPSNTLNPFCYFVFKAHLHGLKPYATCYFNAPISSSPFHWRRWAWGQELLRFITSPCEANSTAMGVLGCPAVPSSPAALLSEQPAALPCPRGVLLPNIWARFLPQKISCDLLWQCVKLCVTEPSPTLLCLGVHTAAFSPPKLLNKCYNPVYPILKYQQGDSKD